MMANVLSLVSYKIFPAKLGGQRGIALFNQYFSTYHKLTCVTIKANDPSMAPYEMLNILSNSRLRYINFFYFFRLKSLIRRYQITHLIIEHPYYGWLGVVLKWFCGVRLIVHSHNIEGLRFKSTGKWWWGILWNYEAFVHRQASFTFCITDLDRQYMIDKFGIRPSNSTVITYGIDGEEAPSKNERINARHFLEEKYGILKKSTIYLFNGTLDYLPNFEALKNIIDKINPIFIENGMPYKIIICGKNLPVEMEGLGAFIDKNIIYAGFVDDISIYFKGADIFINPVTEGGGIKTKLVEALGYNLNAVSTLNGAIGVSTSICNGKLLLTKDLDWNDFALKMKDAISINKAIPGSYFEHFSWKNIAMKAADSLHLSS